LPLSSIMLAYSTYITLEKLDPTDSRHSQPPKALGKKATTPGLLPLPT